MTSSASDELKTSRIVDLLSDDLNVKLIAIDFDKTLIDINSTWIFNVDITKLKAHLRPVFLNLIPAAIGKGTKCCIVTFNFRKKMIRDLLNQAFSENIARHIIIESGKKYERGLGFLKARWHGKEPYLVKAVTKLKEKHNLPIKNNEIFLIDDYQPNINVALKNNHYCYKIDDSSNIEELLNYVYQLVNQNKNVLKTDQSGNLTFLVSKVNILNGIIS